MNGRSVTIEDVLELPQLTVLHVQWRFLVQQDTVITINPVDNEEEAGTGRCHLKMHDNYVKAIRNQLDIRG